MDQIIEQWRPVVGWEGYYEVSDQGRVRTVERKAVRGSAFQIIRARIRKLWVRPTPTSAYWCVCLCVTHNGFVRQKTPNVHVLVLEAFAGPRPDGMVACHGIGGPLDNRLENLSWGTRSKNGGEDRQRDGTHFMGERSPRAKLTADQVRAIRADSRAASAVAADYGLSKGYVCAIRRGKTWVNIS